MKIGGFLSNDSMFGKVMTKFGTMIVLNILFVISCLPFVTIGPALSALYYSIIEMLRKEEEDMVLGTGGEINPVTVYFKGFRRDFSKCMLYWILFVGIMIMGTINIQISGSWKGRQVMRMPNSCRGRCSFTTGSKPTTMRFIRM